MTQHLCSSSLMLNLFIKGGEAPPRENHTMFESLSDPSSRLSTSPPPPAIAVPLLEMGFSLRQITKALEATGQSSPL
ncbi:putative E3 ubiquitin-protein ligase HERC1, partial [Nibea albiflora]